MLTSCERDTFGRIANHHRRGCRDAELGVQISNRADRSLPRQRSRIILDGVVEQPFIGLGERMKQHQLRRTPLSDILCLSKEFRLPAVESEDTKDPVIANPEIAIDPGAADAYRSGRHAQHILRHGSPPEPAPIRISATCQEQHIGADCFGVRSYRRSRWPLDYMPTKRRVAI
jgi:hypothetical protein